MGSFLHKVRSLTQKFLGFFIKKLFLEVLNSQVVLLNLVLQSDVLLDELLISFGMLKHVLVKLVHPLLQERLVFPHFI